MSTPPTASGALGLKPNAEPRQCAASRDTVSHMIVTVIGSGNGGLATAFDFALHGHTVRLFDTPEFPDQVAEVAAAGGIHATGEIEGFAEIAYSGHDIELALEGAELIVLVGPAYSTEH